PNCLERSLEKLVKYAPEVSAPELGGILNLSELAPEALTLVSSVGFSVGSPAAAKMPKLAELSPLGMSAALSKPTHLPTSGFAQRSAKLRAPAGGFPGGGGEGGAGGDGGEGGAGGAGGAGGC